MQKAILVDKEVEPVRADTREELVKCGKAFQSDRRVGLDQIKEVKVSTVFLGINHGFGGTPLWFETIVFGGANDRYQERYETHSEALAGHARIVEATKNGERL